MTNLISLPIDIKLIVIDFLSIDDCFILQELKREFFNGVRTSFWSKKLFEKHIQHPEKLLNILKYSDYKPAYYTPSFAEFGNFFDAQALWQGLMSNQKKVFNFFASISKTSEEAENFVNRVYKVLNDPSLPIPAMKRETQYLPTSSEFENFLTELHFEVRPCLNTNDKDYLMLKNSCEAIRELTVQNKKVTPKSKKIELNRRSSKFFSKYSQRTQKVEKQTTCSCSQRKITARKSKENKRIRIEGFLGVQGIVKSHCKIIRNYLSSLTEDKIILKEYKRCWKEFTYSMIELNSLMQPYEELLTSKDLPKFYKNDEMVSFWKVMVDSWLSEVYNKVGLKLKASFQNLLIDTITKEVVDNHPRFEHNEKKIKSEMMGFNSSNQYDVTSSEKTVRLLKKSFIALSDISLYKSGVNVLEWDSSSELQPKVKLISFLYPGIKDLLEETIEVYDKESSKVGLSQTLRNIQNIFEEVFNDEIGLEEHQGGEKEISVEISDLSESIDSDDDIKKEKTKDFHMIAGQYKIISKCKWENRLSQIYPRTENLVSCY